MQGVPVALFYEPLPDQRVLCTRCPHDCRIAAGGRGACGVRYNDGGKLYWMTYGFVTLYITNQILYADQQLIHPQIIRSSP